ncbi:MAG: LPP20 family lipoprotein [Phycisphaerae bacterium]|nr:LPP20 family lipoprotein [Phycisphaerae bacterium]
MNRRKLSLCAAILAAVIVSPMAHAQDDPAKYAQNKLLSKRAAEADAYRKLAETVYGLQISSDTYVRDFVTESDTIRTSMDHYIRGVRLGTPRWDSDLTCTIEAEVTVAKLIEELTEVHKRHYKGNKIHAEDFTHIKQYYKKDIITAVGMGAPRPDLPPEVPGGDIAIEGNLPEPAIPDIWKAVSPQHRLMAVRAAQVDAMRRLVERLKGLRITSDTLVRDFVAESDVITAESKATLTGATEVGRPYFHSDELIVEVTYEVPVESVITTIKTLYKKHYKGDRVTAMNIEEVSKVLKTQKFQATGMGVPKPEQIRAAAAQIKETIPDWVGQTISAEGAGVPPEDKSGTPQGKLMAARAAELDAKRKLAEEVMGFRIDSSTTVRDFVTEHDEINARLNTYLQGSYVKSTRYDSDGTSYVVVEMPAMQVWEVVHTYIKIKRT